MTALHTAYTYSVVPQGRGVVITIREKLVVGPELDPAKRRLNPFAFIITPQLISEPREVVLYCAAPNTLERVCCFMDSLTDDLIYHQWFKVKVHKNKEKKPASADEA